MIAFKVQRLELLGDEIGNLAELARFLSVKSKLTKRELQVLVGYMPLAPKAVYGARTFIRLFMAQ